VAEIELRPAAPEDAPRLKEIVRAAYGDYVERMGFEPRPMTDDYAEVIANWKVTVAEDGGEVVGLVVHGRSEEGFVIDNVAVDPARKGTGLGRLLIEHAEEAARADGFDSIYLYTHETMTENISLYGRVGYAEYARRAPDDSRGSVVFMRKQLG
jgi:ribosomal protein S18 acetylase RimI-like enzyme